LLFINSKGLFTMTKIITSALLALSVLAAVAPAANAFDAKSFFEAQEKIRR
jgi:hypothetical protein